MSTWPARWCVVFLVSFGSRLTINLTKDGVTAGSLLPVVNQAGLLNGGSSLNLWCGRIGV